MNIQNNRYKFAGIQSIKWFLSSIFFFRREICKHDRFRRNHVSAEYILYLIANGNLDEAQDLRRTPLPTFKYLADKFHIELETEWELRRFALSGMLLYLQWLKETDDQTAMENEKDEEGMEP